MRRRRGTRAPCHRIGPNVTPTAPYALYASRGGGPGGLTIIAILDLLGGAAQCMVAAGPMHGIQLPATDACKCMALYGGLCGRVLDTELFLRHATVSKFKVRNMNVDNSTFVQVKPENREIQ